MHRACGEVVLGRRGLELLELQFQLLEQPRLALGPRPVERPPQLLDLEPEGRDHRLGVGQHRPVPRSPGRLRFRGHSPRLGGRKGGAQGVDLARLGRHVRSLSRLANALE